MGVEVGKGFAGEPVGVKDSLWVASRFSAVALHDAVVVFAFGPVVVSFLLALFQPATRLAISVALTNFLILGRGAAAVLGSFAEGTAGFVFRIDD
jgi:hypothetical protein